MKFDYCIGNPPYQEEGNNKKIYPYFYLAGRSIGRCLELIFPSNWQDFKKANGLQLLNSAEIKEDEQIVFIDNRNDAFPNVAGAKDVNILMWKQGYCNGLNGSQFIYTNGKNKEVKHLTYKKEEMKKPEELLQLYECVIAAGSFNSMQSAISVRKPYGLATDIADNTEKYNLPEMQMEKIENDDLVLICAKNKVRYMPRNYPLPRVTDNIHKYKCFIPNAWGNLSESFVGGAYADIMIAKPDYVCSETYLEVGGFDSYEIAYKQAKYLMTKFLRALLFVNKTTLLCVNAWSAVPVQDCTEDFWNGTIEEIDKALMDKYNVPEHIREFVDKNIQPRTEKNIVGLGDDNG